MASDVSNDAGRPAELLDMTADIVAGYVANNPLPIAELPALMTAVHGALSRLGQSKAAAVEKPTPHVPIKKTVTPDYLISLEDGRQYRTLKRHLTGRGLTPQQYREKWGLPLDYPMAAPNYSARRSELAKSIGLGSLRSRTAAKASASDPVKKAPAKKRAARKSV